MVFILVLLKLEELVVFDYCFMFVRCLSERLKKIIYLLLLFRDFWKLVLIGKRNLSVSNEIVFIIE